MQIALFFQQEIMGQFVPIPPPSNEPPSPGELHASTQHTPPQFHIFTDKLHEGKNVFKVGIVDASGIKSAFLKYVQNGQIKLVSLAYEGRDMYEGLVDIRPPSRIIEIHATDNEGKTNSTYAQYDLLPPRNILDIFTEFFSRLANLLNPNSH